MEETSILLPKWKTKLPEGSFNNFISQLEIDLNEEDTFSFFDAAFRFYFEATTLHYRNSNPTFTDCLSFLRRGPRGYLIVTSLLAGLKIF